MKSGKKFLTILPFLALFAIASDTLPLLDISKEAEGVEGFRNRRLEGDTPTCGWMRFT